MVEKTVPLVLDPELDRRVAAEQVLQAARSLAAAGNRHAAADLIERNLHAGLWSWGRLWKELVALMSEPADYERIRRLWLEAPKRCNNSLAIIRAVTRAAGAAGEHDDARALLRLAMTSQASSHRRPRVRLRRARTQAMSSIRSFARPWRQLPDSFGQRASVALGALIAELDRQGVRAFIISGTLLGYLREGAFISWDKDIDVGVFTSEINHRDVESAFLHSPDFAVRRLDFNSDRLRVDHVNGIMVDIFPHYMSDTDGKVWHDGTATRWWNTSFGLKEIEFLGQRQYMPDNPELYLDENYGNWRVPETNFDARIDAPNVEVTDKDYFDTLLYFSLLTAIVKRDPVKRDRYVRLLRGIGEGAWLDHL